MRNVLPALLLASTLPACAAQVDDRTALSMARPEQLITAEHLSTASQRQLLKPVDAFYAFWNNGSEALLLQALSPEFQDHTLPPGRPQGIAGPAVASKAFLAAVPDLKVVVQQQIVAHDRVISHLRFTGHFSGTFAGVKGQGQPLDFIATDILRISNGRITDNWHLEDNLTFMRQAGLLPGGTEKK